MKKLLYTLAAGAILAGVAAPATAQATRQNHCVDGSNKRAFRAELSRGSGTISVRDGRALCQSVDLVLESFVVPDTWDGTRFNSTAIPQTMHGVTYFTIPAGTKNYSQTFSVDTPNICKNTQLDFYFAPEYASVNTLTSDNGRYIYGKLFRGTGDCTPAPTTPVEEEKTPIHKCVDLSATQADRTNFAFTTTAEIENAELEKVVYTVKDSDDNTVDTITRTDLKSVDYVQKTTGDYSVSSAVHVTVDGESAIAEGTCVADFNVAAAPVDEPETPVKEVVVEEAPVETPAPAEPTVLPNTGAASVATTFVGISALGTAVASFVRQRFNR